MAMMMMGRWKENNENNTDVLKLITYLTQQCCPENDIPRRQEVIKTKKQSSIVPPRRRDK
jgi:hypothetical protein